MKDHHETDYNTGWWAERPEREIRASSFSPIAGPFKRRRGECIWLNAALVVALFVTLCWSIVRLASW
ncbi:hypothetical protein [Variovorax sp. KK3]|uniref:hypothetical protein n=1 Tax=Variovorax sp. KK3 TaxID=1855728 RepID=UPI00118007B7|nr:hypothetical protein [Variovorax sp. KK3]